MLGTGYKLYGVWHRLCNIISRECFITFSNTEKRVKNTKLSGGFFERCLEMEMRGVKKCDETLFRVFDISS